MVDFGSLVGSAVAVGLLAALLFRWLRNSWKGDEDNDIEVGDMHHL